MIDNDALLLIGLSLLGASIVILSVLLAKRRKIIQNAELKASEIVQKAQDEEKKSQDRIDRLKETDKEMVAKLKETRSLIEGLSDLAGKYAADIEVITDADLLGSPEYQKDRKEVVKELKKLACNAIVGVKGANSNVNITNFVAISAKADMAGALLLTTVEMLCGKSNHNNGHQVIEKLSETIVGVEALVKILDSRAKIDDRFKALLLKRLEIEINYKVAKQRAKEEQRELREQQKEEERVRKEAMAAQQAAEKEEEIKKKAMEEIREKMLLEGESEREKYEAQLEALQKELEEAHARAERAKSRAQETRQGHVYVISNIGSFGENVLKIGMTRRLDPLDRVKELGDASVPFSFDVHALIEVDDAPELENRLHKIFESKRVNKINLRKEYFYITADEIENKLQELEIEALFNKIPSADEYYQSLRLAQSKS